MSINCFVNSNDIFNKMNELSLETRRYLLGKYETTPQYETNFTKITPSYCGEKKCHLKFNFTTDGPRCFWCNTICLLTENGDIISNEHIPIKSGTYKGQIIKIIKYPLIEIPFGTYKPISANHNSHLENISKIVSKQRMINCSDESSHDIAISSLINSDSNLPFKSTTLGSWICNDINILKIVPTLGTFNTCIFTPELVKTTIFQLFILSASENFSHGSPSTDNMWISNFPSVFTIDKTRKINMLSTIFLDLDIYSSYVIEYQNRFLYFVGKNSQSDIKEPVWNINFKFDNGKGNCENLTKSPCMKSYLNERISTILPSMELMNYIRFTGINVFPQFYYFIYMTIALLNRSFYDLFMKSNVLKIFQKIFLNGDYEKYINVINLHIGQHKTADEIVQLLIDTHIEIRHDIFLLIKHDILNFMLTEKFN